MTIEMISQSISMNVMYAKMGLELVIAGFSVRHTTEHDVEPGDTGT